MGLYKKMLGWSKRRKEKYADAILKSDPTKPKKIDSTKPKKKSNKWLRIKSKRQQLKTDKQRIRKLRKLGFPENEIAEAIGTNYEGVKKEMKAKPPSKRIIEKIIKRRIKNKKNKGESKNENTI